jgi:hypothetical protein
MARRVQKRLLLFTREESSMRRGLKTLLVTGVAASGALLAATASATAPTADGVFFVHGTGNYNPPTETCSPNCSSYLNPTSGTAISGYWTQSSINSMIADPSGAGNWNYGVAGYAGATNNAQTSYATIATQLLGFYHSYGPLLNIVVVTHSNGSNPVRYLMAHPTAIITDPEYGNVCAGYLVGGTCTSGHYVGTYSGIIKKAVFIAGDDAGTPLADDVVKLGNFTGISNTIVNDVFGPGATASTGAIPQQVQATMTTYNGNGTFAVNSNLPEAANIIYGSGVNANIFSSEAYCGGYLDSAGLYATALIGWGSSSGTDGFIGTNSSTYVGTDPNGYGGDSRLNHNQSRRSCDGVNSHITSYIHSTLSGAFTAPPADYTEPAAVQACGVFTTPAWYPDNNGNPNQWYIYGCTPAMHQDTNVDIDCEAVYGTDDWNGTNYTVTIPFDYAETGYSNTTYYDDGATGCSDSWLGDGQCDLCLLAKYGYDTASGSTGNDDCYNAGTGSQSVCADLVYSEAASAIVYASITVTH